MPLAFIFAIVSSATIIIIAGMHLLSKIISAKKRNSRLKSQISKLQINSQHESHIEDTVIRANVLYNSFVLHNTLCLICHIFSAIFTVCGLFMTYIDGYDVYQQILSYLSVFFVLLTIYLIPKNRSKQYLLGWRKIDGHILTLFTADYLHMSDEEKNMFFENSIKIRIDVEASLKEDEEN